MAKRLRRLWWIYRCTVLVHRFVGTWSWRVCWEYADSLHETYVIDDDESWTPRGAFDEDLTYWGD